MEKQPSPFSYQKVISEEILTGNISCGLYVPFVSQSGQFYPVRFDEPLPSEIEKAAFDKTLRELLQRPGSSMKKLENALFKIQRRLGFGDGWFSGLQTIDGHSEHAISYCYLEIDEQELLDVFGKKIEYFENLFSF